MSFIHYEIVAHVDPTDPIQFGAPSRPKVLREIDPQVVEHVLKSFSPRLDHIVELSQDGCAICVWSSVPSVPWATIERFLTRLADEANAVVLSQLLVVWYPESAKSLYEANLDAISASWDDYRRRHDERK